MAHGQPGRLITRATRPPWQAFEALGRVREARFKLTEVIKYSKHNKNADAEKLLGELEGKVDTPKPATPAATGAGAKAARRALIREDRAQRLTVQEVNDALTSRCEHFSILHKPWDRIRCDADAREPSAPSAGAPSAGPACGPPRGPQPRFWNHRRRASLAATPHLARNAPRAAPDSPYSRPLAPNH